MSRYRHELWVGLNFLYGRAEAKQAGCDRIQRGSLGSKNGSRSDSIIPRSPAPVGQGSGGGSRAPDESPEAATPVYACNEGRFRRVNLNSDYPP